MDYLARSDLPTIRVGNDVYVEVEVADISAESAFDAPGIEPPLADPNDGVTLAITRGALQVSVLPETVMTRLSQGIYSYTHVGTPSDVVGLYNIELKAYHGSKITASQFYGAYRLVA